MQPERIMHNPDIGDKVIVHYDDGTFTVGVLVEPKPCWQYLESESGNVYIIDNRAICIEKVEDEKL